MHNSFYDHSPMWPRFNHGCPKRPPEDAEPYNTPFAVLAYTEGGDPVITVHTVDGETEEINVKDKILILKDTTYTLSSDDTSIILTDSEGNEQAVPVFESAEATPEQAGFMSPEDKQKLDGIQAHAQVNPSVVTTAKNGLMSYADKVKLDAIEEGAQRNVEISPATTTAAGLMSASDKSKLDNIPASVTTYDLADWENDGLMSSGQFAKLSGIEVNAEQNTIDGIKLNGTLVPPDSDRIVNLTVSGGGGGQTYDLADWDNDGLMSSGQFAKLSGIEVNAEHNIITGIKLNGTLVSPDSDRVVNLTVSGGGGGGSGDANVIEIVKVNGTALAPDSNKAVDIDLSSYATTSAMNQAIATAIGAAMSASY